jgi:hypothetical protein
MSNIYTPYVSGAFVPMGNTITFLANTQAPTPVQAVQTGSNTVSYCQYRIFNSGSSLIFLGVGSNTLNANTNAQVVTSSQNSIPVLPGSLEILSLPSNSYFTAVTSSGTSQVYVTPGLGI